MNHHNNPPEAAADNTFPAAAVVVDNTPAVDIPVGKDNILVVNSPADIVVVVGHHNSHLGRRFGGKRGRRRSGR